VNNHFISEIKATKTVLCVVKGVIKTTDKAEIKRTDITDVNKRFMIDTSLHSDTFFLLPANQSLLILLNTECLVEKQQISSL
jgi:hypothetical protein